MSSGSYSPENHHLASPGDMVPGLYDGTSSESSASSPMNYNGYDTSYGTNGFMTYPAYPMAYPTHNENVAPVGLIPVELEIEGLYEDYDRRRRKNGSEKIVSSHVHSRRRAQNRASQRAFRDRKEKHMRELEQRLGELEGRHTDLSRSYESLQLEYSSVKQELDRLKSDNSRQDGSSKHHQSSRDIEDSRREILDPLLFDVSAFCFDQDDGHSAVE
ncbi:putative AP-1-like transcription factor [Glarea lozoyensis 74030]|uniref:Putative transcription factor kapC n=1 Tax=Glarea lozoyensis (strain ATCC 74030 / MF5533) TaxID=1104152 RepID=H0ET53_GLAL7|nr:putative AP-1-like transcription factor [Glarea lozoyensis 74030]